MLSILVWLKMIIWISLYFIACNIATLHITLYSVINHHVTLLHYFEQENVLKASNFISKGSSRNDDTILKREVVKYFVTTILSRDDWGGGVKTVPNCLTSFMDAGRPLNRIEEAICTFVNYFLRRLTFYTFHDLLECILI